MGLQQLCCSDLSLNTSTNLLQVQQSFSVEGPMHALCFFKVSHACHQCTNGLNAIADPSERGCTRPAQQSILLACGILRVRSGNHCGCRIIWRQKRTVEDVATKMLHAGAIVGEKLTAILVRILRSCLGEWKKMIARLHMSSSTGTTGDM